MNDNYLEKLEYFQITKKLSNFCITNQGKQKAINLKPYHEKEIVQKNLIETEEAVNIIYKNNTPTFAQIEDNTIAIKTLEAYGTLSAKSLLDLNKILKTAQGLKDYFSVDYIEKEAYTNLNNYFEQLYTNLGITQKIEQSIEDENTISDEASQELKNIRRKQRKLEQEIKNKLTNMIHNSNFSKYMQENVVTIRNDRYVVPVKEEYRNQIKGFVHDVSSSGSTIFIEPIAVFEANNELNNLKAEEIIEIEKILENLSKLFYPYIEELKKDIDVIGILDFIFAKAKLSKEMKAITPQINEEKKIELKQARHPLIDMSKVVPITLTLGKDYATLVITGPNTGGKTVTLKTVGLLTCMACSGLNIPAEENSSIHVFDNIFADIGDDQSISDSLSTFSSHMLNIIEILENANENSLVLVDELGSGTDPLEGEALAISILEELQKIGVLTISTTHYQALKKYALVTPNFENASVEFDINTLSPTYRLLIGIPGKSNAFAISQKLGLSKEIIKNAKQRLTKKDIDFEEILKQIYDDKSQIEKEKEKIRQNTEEIEILKRKLKRDNEIIEEQETERIQKAKREAREIIEQAKEEASKTIKAIEEIKNESEQNFEANRKLNKLRNKLNEEIKNLSSKDNSGKLKENQEDIDKKIKELKEILKPNTEVLVKSLQKEGIAISMPTKANEVQVMLGNIKMNIKLEDIEILEKNKSKQKNHKNGYTSSQISKSKTAKTEINVIGLTVEEARMIVEKFLDDASLAKIQNVRIVHGKGTGKLREGIHQLLKKNPHVKSHRMGTFGEGEMGVTIVELK